MKYECFEDLPVWKSVLELACRVYVLTRSRFFSQPGDFRDQLRRAVLSMSNNIAEGFDRGSTAELLAFLFIARGSAGEVRSMLHFSATLLENTASDAKSEISNLKSEISDLKSLAESCSRQIRAWADSLQNSPIKGPRHLNDQTRQAYSSQSRAEAFRSKMQSDFRDAHPELFPDAENDP